MLKRFLILLACISLLFVSPLYADELDNKVDTSSSKETLAIMGSQFGETKLRSMGVPGYDNVNRAVIRWYRNAQNFMADLQPGATAQGLMLCIDTTANSVTQNNVVRFNLPTSYGEFDYTNLFIRAGTYEDIEIDGNTVIVYNPHWGGDNSVLYDVCIGVPFVTPYTNTSDSAIYMQLDGSFNNLSSGTELIDILSSHLTLPMVVEVLATTITVCIGFVFMWWGLRKTSGAIMSAFRRGKLRI